MTHFFACSAKSGKSPMRFASASPFFQVHKGTIFQTNPFFFFSSEAKYRHGSINSHWTYSLESFSSLFFLCKMFLSFLCKMTSHPVLLFDPLHSWSILRANILTVPTSGVEVTSLWGIDWTRDIPLEKNPCFFS